MTHVTIDSLSTALISFVVLKFIQKENTEDSIKGALVSGLIRGSASGLAAVVKTVIHKRTETNSKPVVVQV